MSEFFRRIKYLLNRRRHDQDLVNDMEFHREMAARAGNSHFGNTLQLREEAREAWGWMWIERLAQDLRYAARMLRKSPGFTLAAILMLAIGIGVNVAAFGFFDLIVLRPLDVRDPATLLRFHRRGPEHFAFALPYPEMAFFRSNSRTLSAFLALTPAKLAAEGEQKQITAHFVSSNFFTELGARGGLGRMLDPARDDAPGAAPVVVISHGFWQRHFAADPLVVGKSLRLNGKPQTIVGVASPQFSGLSLDRPDLWAPITQQPQIARGSLLLTDFSWEGTGVQFWGRVQPGVTPPAAEAELESLAAELRKQHPLDIWEHEKLPSEPGAYASSLLIGNRRGSGSEGRSDLYPVAAMIGALGLLILLAACGNLGSLLLARGVSREREIAIRVSVGAGSARLIRQLFTESLMLALLGSVAGLGLGYAVLRGLMNLTGSPSWLDPTPDWRVAAFAVGAGLLAAILFGLTPALHGVRQRHRSTRMRQVLVGAQVAASCILLIVAGLLTRALAHAITLQPGFDYRQVISIDPGLGNHGYTPRQARTYLDTLQSRLRSLPGVASVCLTDTAPLGRRVSAAKMDMYGHPVEMLISHVDPQFFETLKIPLLRGRNLTQGELNGVVVSESLARRAWPSKDPLGQPLSLGETHAVVGVSGSARLARLEDPDMAQVYFPVDPDSLPSMVVLIRTEGPPEGLVQSAVSIAKSLDPEVFPEVQLLKNSFRDKLKSAQYIAVTVSLLGVVALLLACLGIVGLVSYAVSQRTREIGIRMALGANPAQVLSVILRQFSRPVSLGLLVGVAGAAALSQILRRVLYGISNLDPATYLAAIAIFATLVIAAALLPARRALRVDPLRALRYD